MNSKYLPNNNIWDDERGLLDKKKKLVVCNAIPVVDKCMEIHNKKENRIYTTVTIHYQYCKQGISEEMQEFTMEQIKNKSFMKQQPDSVIVEPMFTRKISDVFCYIIQSQALDMIPERIDQYEYGWNGQYFFTDFCNGICIDDPGRYNNALELADIMVNGDDVIIALVLGTLHGFLVRPLFEKGLDHNFVTVIKGSSGVGKTELARRLCCILKDKQQMISLTSSRKELRKHLEVVHDMPLVIDDYARTLSARMAASQLQILAEIIQTSCNAGKVLLDDVVCSDDSRFIHVIVTAEQLINNISTINRCYLVEMDEKISDESWRKVCDFAESDGMLKFMISILKYISDNYSDFFSRAYSDYTHFQSESAKRGAVAGNSTNRINQTWAVQMTLAKILIDYFSKLNLDRHLLELLDSHIRCSTRDCIGGLKTKINKLQNEGKHMQYLPELYAQITNRDWGGLSIADSEEKYFNPKNGKQYLGVVLNSGYISFSPRKICNLLERSLQVSVSPKALSSELTYYGLAYVDKEGKVSSRWNSNHRMYHVNVRQLLELIEPEIDELYKEQVISNFEFKYE